MQTVKILIKHQDRNNYYNEDGDILDQFVQRGCEISILRERHGNALGNLIMSVKFSFEIGSMVSGELDHTTYKDPLNH